MRPFFVARRDSASPAQHIRAQGIITTSAGTEWVFAGDGKPALDAPLGNINAVTLDRSGNLVVADPGNGVDWFGRIQTVR